MAKGQMRSNREVKKPKKEGAGKAKMATGSAFAEPSKSPAKSPSKKK
ncbi:MAG: hypothetical protein JWL84_2126 [Rhodospirillales bacterium]|jgi:hypothetical protein|nr:hypothetical protein [Rhodospirillales bacterium]